MHTAALKNCSYYGSGSTATHEVGGKEGPLLVSHVIVSGRHRIQPGKIILNEEKSYRDSFLKNPQKLYEKKTVKTE
jgi:hypothetical protein